MKALKSEILKAINQLNSIVNEQILKDIVLRNDFNITPAEYKDIPYNSLIGSTIHVLDDSFLKFEFLIKDNQIYCEIELMRCTVTYCIITPIEVTKYISFEEVLSPLYNN